ncbi:hypothetical protein CLCR_11325 [Cladophialophora carrionii]|uniref:Uncharacterized protein n=1 Tax=Cladophialophora carrionii TaxID=86049 RepID=A0A1C1CJZ4_9EURO|nr:hypothetical protein CLCR_11325 [Cladophialophora carrionii]
MHEEKGFNVLRWKRPAAYSEQQSKRKAEHATEKPETVVRSIVHGPTAQVLPEEFFSTVHLTQKRTRHPVLVCNGENGLCIRVDAYHLDYFGGTSAARATALGDPSRRGLVKAPPRAREWRLWTSGLRGTVSAECS